MEFGTTAITSPGPGEAIAPFPLGEAFTKYNREVLFNNQTAKGFLILTLTHAQARAELIAVSTIKDKVFTTRPIAVYHVTPGPTGVSALKPVSGDPAPDGRRNPGTHLR